MTGRGRMGICFGQAQAFFTGRAEPAPPRGWPIQARMAFRGKPGDNAEGGSLGGARSPRPDCNALLMPRHFITLGGWPGGRSIMGTCLGQTGALLRACGARPSTRWAIQAKRALRGKPWDNAGGGFLGGARSPRPEIRAGSKRSITLSSGANERLVAQWGDPPVEARLR
jgi:hypothetical protein